MSEILGMVYPTVKQMARNLSAGLQREGRAEDRSCLRYVALFVLLAGFSAGVRAQDIASITGVVTDKTAARVPDASVKLTNSATGAEYETKTGASGDFLIPRYRWSRIPTDGQQGEF